MRFKNDKKWEKECLGTCPEGGRGRPGGAKSVSSTTHWSKNPSEVPATMTDGSLSLHAKEIMGPQMFADEKAPTGSARKRGEAAPIDLSHEREGRGNMAISPRPLRTAKRPMRFDPLSPP